MEVVIGIVVLYALYKMFSKKKNSGGCKYCGGELFPTSKEGYSFKCSDCREYMV